MAETQLGQLVHYLRPGEGFREEYYIGMIFLDLAYHPLPETEWLGVGVIYPEDVNPLADPEGEYTLQLIPKLAPLLRFKVQRVDIRIFLGGSRHTAPCRRVARRNHSGARTYGWSGRLKRYV